MRDEERKRRQQDRDRARSMKIWEKTTSQSHGGGGSGRLKELMRGAGGSADDSAVGGGGEGVTRRTQQTRDLVTAAKTAIAQDRRQEKENMAEFIAKKREMFLVQMSLDTKREEIRKLEEKAQMKEEALKKSEQMLEEDAIRFDTFLKENDKKAHEAIKKAEKETKLKTDRVQEIKKLNQQIQMVQSDMSKHREALEDCLKYVACRRPRRAAAPSAASLFRALTSSPPPPPPPPPRQVPRVPRQADPGRVLRGAKSHQIGTSGKAEGGAHSEAEGGVGEREAAHR